MVAGLELLNEARVLGRRVRGGRVVLSCKIEARRRKG